MRQNEQANERRCEQLGDLAASALPETPVSQQQWTQLHAALADRPRRRRWILLAPAFAALLLLGVQARRTLHMDVQGCEHIAQGLHVPAHGQGVLAFDDGTRIKLAAGSRAGVEAHGFRRGAHLDLREGHLDLAVIHRWSGRWEVTAGPFQVRVTGTRFAVDWSPAVGRFSVAVSQGEVRVTGGPLTDERRVRAGEHLDVNVAPQVDAIPVQAPVPPAIPDPQPMAPDPQPAAPAPQPALAPPPSTLAAKATARPRHERAQAARSPEARPAPRPVELPETPEAVAVAAPPPEKPAPELPPPAPTSSSASEEKPVRKVRRHIQGPQGPIWVTGAPRTIFTDQASTPDHAYVEDGVFCTRGILPALICSNVTTPNIQCDWTANWGVLIGWNPTSDLARTAASALTFEYRGRTGSYRLTAHRRGDPASRVYCIDRYRSGRAVEPADFQLSCWEGGGPHLADFSDVDTFGLQVLSSEEATPFRFCLSNIALE